MKCAQPAKGASLPNYVFDDCPAVDEGKIRECLAEVPIGQGIRMGFGSDHLELGPGE